MQHSIGKYIEKRLEERRETDNFRSLKILPNHIDFTSNDYLGIARDQDFSALVQDQLLPNKFLGSTGSRLLSGNNEIAIALENKIAVFHKGESALLMNSGFDANSGLLAALPYKGDTILFDEKSHASIHDGCRAGKANAISFQHNNCHDLEEKLRTATGLKYVVVESIYSMDGDLADLKNISALCEKYEAGLIVDEAHATGILGHNGGGLVNQLELESKCLARVHTFGKALGSFGAAIICSEQLKQFLINYCRPFIFSTALPPQLLLQLHAVYNYFPHLQKRRELLQHYAAVFQQQIQSTNTLELPASATPIQSVIMRGSTIVTEAAETLQRQGFDVRPIRYPTVAKNSERIRVCLHSFNSEEEILSLASAINKLKFHGS
ncbi:MAG: 8-amino-7-oxononanoate synthase [Chitinophagales bacterium]